jgi:YVTN family beta-propeller protein
MRPNARPHRLAAALLLAVLAASPAPAAQPLALPGPANWKYLFEDPPSHTLFIAQGSQVTAVDTAAMRIRGRLTGLRNAHGVAIVPGGRGYVADSKSAAVIVFDPATLHTIATIPAGADTNSLAYDPASRRLFAANDDAGTVTVIDPATDRATATIPLPGEEGIGAMIPDAAGHLFLAHPATGDIVRLSTIPAAPQIDATWKLPHCPKPEGLALAAPAHLLFVSCTSGMLLTLDARDGAQHASAPIGPGNLALVLDPVRGRLYVPAANAKMPVFQLSPTGTLTALPPIPTGPGARSAALEPMSGRLYLVTAEPTAAADKPARFSPGTATLLAIDAPR